MGSKYFFSLHSIPYTGATGGKFQTITSKEVPALEGISFSSLHLNKMGALEPIWHPNADKIGYCEQGFLKVTIRGPTTANTFTVESGDVFFIPQGHVHSLENLDQTESHIHFALNHHQPQTMHLTNAIFSLNEAVFEATFSTPSTFLSRLKKAENNRSMTLLPSKNQKQHAISSPLKFNISESRKAIVNKGGYLQTATRQNLSILHGLGILGFGLHQNGVVEPHWHTNCGELVFIVKGSARMTVSSPDGDVEVLNLKGGEGAFAPASFFHSIQNTGQDEVEVIAFFSHADPDYIGLGEAVGSFSNELLASIFNVEPDYFDSLKRTQEPLVIVPV